MNYEQVIILRVDDETRKWLDDLSAQSGVTISAIVRGMLKEIKVSGVIAGGKVVWNKDR